MSVPERDKQILLLKEAFAMRLQAIESRDPSSLFSQFKCGLCTFIHDELGEDCRRCVLRVEADGDDSSEETWICKRYSELRKKARALDLTAWPTLDALARETRVKMKLR